MSLAARCHGCDVELLPESSFCHACGKAQNKTERQHAPTGEHKPITVLFVDAFGSIGLGDRVDAEQWLDIVESFFSVVSAAVQNYGGTIDRLTGEGIKVLFGAPAALESHATQACHAALHIARRLTELATSFKQGAGVAFSVRMGLNSGEVVFGRVGGNPDRSFTSQGHTAALAARMQQLAAPGQIFLAESTASLVADFFELRQVGALPVRNASTTVQVFELLGSREHRTRLEAARERGLSPFVGRAAEMAELDEALRFAADGAQRFVGIVGEPGVGKSRLAEEFVERQRANGLLAHYTRCVEHGRWIPFHATVPFLRDAIGIEPGESGPELRDKIRDALLSIDAELGSALPVVFTALGAAEPGEMPAAPSSHSPTRNLARVIRRLIEQRDAQRPSIFVVDDQQWMDAASDAVFSELVREPPQSSMLVLVTYRRDHERAWMRDPQFSELPLRPLDRPATLQLVRALVGHDHTLGNLPERIAERAAGNPFFVEELVRSLVEANTLNGDRGKYHLRIRGAAVAVPGTLRAALASRIDQLEPREKSILQTAAVIGREFPLSLLAAVTTQHPDQLAASLRKLETADFLAGLAWGTEAVYVFRHPLLHETVYGSLLSDRQAQIHRDVVRALQSLHGDSALEHAAQIALHAEAAGDHLDAARWHRRAAANSVRWDPAQGLEHWRRVLACAGRQADSDEALRLRLWACEAIVRLGFHQGLTREDAEALIEEGRQIALSLGDQRATALLLSAAGGLRGAAGDVGAAIEHNMAAVALAEAGQHAELAMLFGARLVLSERIAGRLRAALPRADAMLATYRSARIVAPTPGLVALRQLELARTVVLLDRGDLQLGASELNRIIAALRGENAPMVLAWALSLTATLMRHSGDDAPYLVARVEESQALAEHLAVPSLHARTITSFAVMRLYQERWEEARIAAEQAEASLHDVGHTFYVDVNPALILAYAYFGLGEPDRARTAGAEALQLALARGSRLGLIDALAGYGRILLRGTPSERREGRSMLRHGLALVRETRARSREPHLWLELAADARRSGDESRWRASRSRAVRQLIAMNALGHLRRSAGRGAEPLSGTAA